jgi:hypothetical protein
MDPMRCEIDDLTLMDAENSVRAPRAKQRQVGERAEATIAHEYIAFAEPGMNLCDAGHIVSAQRCGHDLCEHSCPNVKQRQKMGHGETAAWLLDARLAKVFLKFRNIGHGKSGTIGDEHAVPMPGSGFVDLGFEPLGNSTE